MASAYSDLADSPEGTSPAVSTPAGSGFGSGSGGTGGVKRGADGKTGDGEQAAAAGVNNKKKRTGTGGRGVANLTPEQLAKKRANDREAQRAIRERTKKQIDALERRIEELTNQKPYQELQAAVRAKEAVERENADIKRQLVSMMDMLRPIIGSASDEAPPHRPLTRPASVAQGPAGSQARAAPTPPGTLSMSPGAAANSSHAHQRSSPGWGAESRNAPSDSAPSDPVTSQLHAQRLQLRQGLGMGGERLGLDFLLRPGQRVIRAQAASHGAQDAPQHQHVPMKQDWVAVNSGREPWTPPWPARPSGYAADSDAEQQQGGGPHQHDQHHASPSERQQARTRQLPLYATPVKNCESTCPLDTILLGFLSERRQRIAEGLPVQEVAGPRYPPVSSLLNPANRLYSHPLAKLFTDVLARLPDISRLPERVAVLYIMFLVLRWQISPTRENYERLPEWMAPRRSQLECAHPAWIDHVPFPVMRERLARMWMSHAGEHEPGQFFIPYTTTLRVSWPYEETDALLMLPEGGDEVVINPVFERHVRDDGNWRLGAAFARAFPQLADTFRVDGAESAGGIFNGG